MKMNIILFCVLITMIGCEKNNANPDRIDKEELSGKWVNTHLSVDTLFFLNDSIIMRTDTITYLPKHRYKYELEEDSIKLKYDGEYYILVLEKSFKISINADNTILNIEGLDNYFPEYKGNQFKKISLEKVN